MVKLRKGGKKTQDLVQQQKLDAGLQPFKLVKYFTFTSLAVILIFTLFLSWAISQNAKKVMLKQSEEYSMVLAENLNQQVFRRFVLPTVVRFGNIALSNPEQFGTLDAVVKSVIQGMKIESVTIYDSSMNIVSYSTVDDIVGIKDLGGVEYELALSGVANSRLLYSGSVVNLLPETKSLSCELRTFIPFRQVRDTGEPSDLIMGVIEIQKDLSKEYENIIRLQGSIIAVSGTVMAVLFLVLRTIVSRAGRIMEGKALERLRLEEQLNQAERLAHLGTMVATVSHEIKSPLGIVRSTAEILEKRIKKVAPGSEHLARIIVDETSRLNDIVMEFLDFARPQETKLQPGNINELVEKALIFIAHKLEEQHIELVKELQADLPLVHLDPEQLYRALLNILVNGIQAMPDGGSLKVRTQIGSKGKVVLAISDNGIGMNEETAEQIFKPFFTDKHKGTGLGLSITKNIIDGHNGEIHIESAINAGTTFFISLPTA
ncbi:two-component system sensor histidine kinase NtrB [Desulfopila aestuarii]|uniref:histidine kinase n=1 Tax=Desulfopila aestuarii DSM 18488 TaxID=1121416 RepID=A0A1M7XZJ9_9BACT|nr:ATP-binding protein [Desulfopila aestuarii]SHO44415.1 His Kinase A (phospho-acceptor) domain-containing protein [Desulfopila aestuarii DSM 18488]